MKIGLLYVLSCFLFSPSLLADEVQSDLYLSSLSFDTYGDIKFTVKLDKNGKFAQIIAQWANGKTVSVPVEELENIDHVDLQSLKVSSLYTTGPKIEETGDLVILVGYDKEIFIEASKDKEKSSKLDYIIIKNVARIHIDNFKYTMVQTAVPDKTGKLWTCSRKLFEGKVVKTGVYESQSYSHPWARRAGEWISQGE